MAITSAIVAAIQSSFFVASCNSLVTKLRLEGFAGQLQAVQTAVPRVPSGGERCGARAKVAYVHTAQRAAPIVCVRLSQLARATLSDRQDACGPLTGSAVSSGLHTAWVTAGGDLGLSQCAQLQKHALVCQIRCAVRFVSRISVAFAGFTVQPCQLVERYLALSRYKVSCASRH